MLNKLIFFIIASLLAMTSHADKVGNGGGLAEQNFIIAEDTLVDRLERILLNPTSNLTTKDQLVIKKIIDSFADEKKAHNELIEFLSAKQNPNIFSSSLGEEIWATAAEVGSTIFINTDKIYTSKNGNLEPINIDFAIRTLFIALAWHQKISDEFYLTGLAYKIALTNNLNQYKKINLSLNQQKIETAYNIEENEVSPQNWIIFLFKKMPTILDFCLQQDRCVSDKDDLTLLQKIRDNMTLEYLHTNLLQFDSGQKNPSLFMIDGEIKSAVTGLQIGSPIYFNTDLLYELKNKRLYPISIYKILTLIIHELGHHTGFQVHSHLDRLGYKVSAFLQDNHRFIDFNEDPLSAYDHKVAHFQLHIIERPDTPLAKNQKPEIYMTDNLYVFQFNAFLEPLLQCPTKTKLSTYRINNMNWTGDTVWSNETRRIPYDYHGEKWIDIQPLIYIFSVDATLLCVDDQGNRTIKSFTHDLKAFYSLEYRASQQQLYTVFEQIKE